jgi:hypothetical protein
MVRRLGHAVPTDTLSTVWGGLSFLLHIPKQLRNGDLTGLPLGAHDPRSPGVVLPASRWRGIF